MPVHQISSGMWQWGEHGKKYKTKAEAEKQARAIFASGYTGKSMEEKYMSDQEQLLKSLENIAESIIKSEEKKKANIRERLAKSVDNMIATVELDIIEKQWYKKVGQKLGEVGRGVASAAKTGYSAAKTAYEAPKAAAKTAYEASEAAAAAKKKEGEDYWKPKDMSQPESSYRARDITSPSSPYGGLDPSIFKPVKAPKSELEDPEIAAALRGESGKGVKTTTTSPKPAAAPKKTQTPLAPAPAKIPKQSQHTSTIHVTEKKEPPATIEKPVEKKPAVGTKTTVGAKPAPSAVPPPVQATAPASSSGIDYGKFNRPVDTGIKVTKPGGETEHISAADAAKQTEEVGKKRRQILGIP